MLNSNTRCDQNRLQLCFPTIKTHDVGHIIILWYLVAIWFVLATGLACLTRFIDKYLHNFFLKDNSMIIQGTLRDCWTKPKFLTSEYLAVFNHLLAYVDSQLYTHLAEMDFIPELFAIPWYGHSFDSLWDVSVLDNIISELLQNLLQISGFFIYSCS